MVLFSLSDHVTGINSLRLLQDVLSHPFSSGTCMKWFHSQKIRGSKDMSCTLGILQEPEGRYKTKSIFCQCPFCINQPFQSRHKKKTLYRLKSGGGSQGCQQSWQTAMKQNPLPGPRATLAPKSPLKSSSQSHLCLIACVVQFLEIGQSLLLE